MAEKNVELADDLRDWMNANGHRWPHDDVITEWITERTGEPPAGLHGDGLLWSHNLFNFPGFGCSVLLSRRGMGCMA